MEKYLYWELYDLEESHWWHTSKKALVLNLAKKYLRKPKSHILDIGCGTGKNVEALSQLGICSGIDNSREAINFCRKRKLPRIKLASAEKTGFADQSFDLVTLLDVLEHTDDQKTLTEVHRILKNKGLGLITVPAYTWLWSKWDEVLHHRRRYNKQSLQNLLEQNGFTILKISYFNSFLILPVAIIRIIKSVFPKSTYGSDFRISFPLAGSVVSILSALETGILEKHNLPMGTSLVCVARKS